MYTDLVRRRQGSPVVVVGVTYHCYGQPTADVSARLQVGLIPFYCEADGYVFNCSLCLHAGEAMHQHNKRGEVVTFLDTVIQKIILIFSLHRLKTLLWWLIPVIEGFSVQNMHVMNTVSPYLIEVMDEKVSLLIRFICSCWYIL